MDSLVSVVIPCYNDAGNLPRAVRSALAQRFLHEIIVVDDCSTDGSFAVAEQLCELDPRIAAFSLPENSGPARARNYGAGFATGHYLAFLDSDDEYLDGHLEMAVDALESNRELTAVKAGVEFLDARGEVLVGPDDPRHEALEFSLPNNVVLLREAFLDMGGFPTHAVFRGTHGGEDVAFNQALAKHLEPLGRLGKVGYRLWDKPDSHLRRFLANTRVSGTTFEFISLSAAQQPGGALERAIDGYMDEVGKRLPDTLTGKARGIPGKRVDDTAGEGES